MLNVAHTIELDQGVELQKQMMISCTTSYCIVPLPKFIACALPCWYLTGLDVLEMCFYLDSSGLFQIAAESPVNAQKNPLKNLTANKAPALGDGTEAQR